MTTYKFETALSKMKEGKKVAREGWNGKGMFVFLAHAIEFETDANLSDLQGLENAPMMYQCFVLKNADDSFTIGWLASQTDLLAEDWYTVDTE